MSSRISFGFMVLLFGLSSCRTPEPIQPNGRVCELHHLSLVEEQATVIHQRVVSCD